MSQSVTEKKVVSRNIAIALIILCIILGGVLVLTGLNYTAQISSRDSIIQAKNSQITTLQNQVSNLSQIVNLQKYTTWVDSQTVSQTANDYTSWHFSATYAGYVVVHVESSITTNTFVRIIWSDVHGISYDKSITVGEGGYALAPVLPASIQIRVGNTNLINGATETVTVTYYYKKHSFFLIFCNKN